MLTESEMIGSISECLMDLSVVAPLGDLAPNRPMLSLVLLHPSAQLLLNGLIDSLDPSIGLRMPWRSPHHNAFWPYLFDF